MPADKRLNEVYPAIRAWAQAHPEIHRVWVFGSRAKGVHRLDSDLDIAAVTFPLPGSTEDRDRFINEVMQRLYPAQLQALLPQFVIDFWAYHTLGVKEGVDEHGILVYESKACL